jgi:hypothetical protein
MLVPAQLLGDGGILWRLGGPTHGWWFEESRFGASSLPTSEGGLRPGAEMMHGVPPGRLAAWAMARSELLRLAKHEGGGVALSVPVTMAF